MAKLAFKAARMSASLADIRQESVSFGDAVEQDGTLFAKSIQEERSRFASKLELLDAVPDSKIYEKRVMMRWVTSSMCERQARTAARATVGK
jgi:hypothetical protein